MTKIERINALLEEIKECVHTCCAITLEPDEVYEKVDKVQQLINEKD